MTITLEQIEARQNELADLITKFKAEKPVLYRLPEAFIELRAGERYAGLVLNDDGTASHHLVLLPGEAEDVTWTDAQEWAAEQRGDLPSRREQALLYTNLKSEFTPNWYWSSEASGSSSAWFQTFYHGSQGYDSQSYEFRARAVRRLSI